MVYSDKTWNNEQILDSDMNRMENGIGGRCARAVVDPGGSKGDYATIQAAINAIGAAGRGRIFLKKGDYTLTSTLTIPHTVEYLEIVGDIGAVLKADAATPPNPMIKVGTDGGIGTGKAVRFANFTTNFNGKAVDGIECFQNLQVWFENLRFINGGVNNAIWIKSCDDAHISHCYFDDHPVGGYCIVMQATERGIILGNTFYDCGEAVHINGGNDIDVTGNHATDPKAVVDAFLLDSVERLAARGNSIDGYGNVFHIINDFDELIIAENKADGITKFIEATGLGANCRSLNVIGNIVKTVDSHCIDVQGAFQIENVNIIGNILDTIQQHGIILDNVQGVVIGDNNIRDPSLIANNTWDGIIVNGCNYVVVKGNTILSLGVNKMRYGINEGGGGNFMNADGNITKGAQTSGVNVTGGGSQQQSNLVVP